MNALVINVAPKFGRVSKKSIHSFFFYVPFEIGSVRGYQTDKQRIY